MIGSAKLLQSQNVAPSTTLNAFITPSFVDATTRNGAYTSPNFTINVTGGTPPYQYAWSATDAFSVNNPTASVTTVSASGYNDFETSVITCVVTDDALNTKSANANIIVTFGVLL